MVSTRLMSNANSNGGDVHSPSGSQTKVVRNQPSLSNSNCIPGTSSRSVAVQSTSLLQLPHEVIEKILSYLPFKNVCSLRLVCHTMDHISGQALNSAFQRLQTQMLNRFLAIKSKMPRRESARRSHHLACESDIIETLHMRLTLLQMSFGKHIERKHCCFFPGEILDEVYNILHYIKVTPKLARPYKVTDELFDLSTMAMEYFKEKIEPELPEIAYFGTDFLDFTGTLSSSSNGKYLALDASPLSSDAKETDLPSCNTQDSTNLVEILPQSNMVLRKRIRKIKQGMKRYNNQLTLLRQDLRTCRRKTAEQQKQIAEQQKQLAEQQKQTLEYAARLDEYDKKNEEISRKFSTLLQELNKCKTELQYWRSKSPANPPFCTGCGNVIGPPPEELKALMNQGVIPEGLILDHPIECDFLPIESSLVENRSNEGDTTEDTNNPKDDIKFDVLLIPGNSKNTKRKANELKEAPLSVPSPKKLRNAPKVRSKRVKL